MDFDMKNMTTYLGCIVLALFVVYLCTNMLSLNNKIVEGLTSAPSTPDQLLESVKNLKSKYTDDLHIDKYKKEYGAILLDVEDILHLQMLDKIKKSIEKNTLTDEKTLASLSQLESTKSALKDLDEFLTHYKST
jgi:hypothetical protein|tara:strand:+ start:16 stop:417 length:402 start_codon:yes stop_codon:yes gene_type:complete